MPPVRVFFFCLFVVLFFVPPPLLHFYFIKIPLIPAPAPPPQPATSNNTAKLHWIPALLLFLIFVRKHKRARIFDTTYFYMNYSCKNENDTQHKTYYNRGTAHNLCTSAEDRILKALKE